MKYIAITIGPIYQTFRNARQTREVWAASFLFSYLAKGIIIRTCLPEFKKGGYSDLSESTQKEIIEKADSFVLPNISDSRLFKPKTGVGLFPDRIIFRSELVEGRDFQTIINAVITDIANEIAEANKSEDGKVFSFLKQYLRIDWNEFEVKGDENPILAISPYLDSLELTPRFVTEIDKNPLSEFFLNINSNGFLEKNYKQKDVNNNIRFESLVEICTRELRGEDEYNINLLWDKNSKKDKDFQNQTEKKNPTDNLFIEALKKHLKNYHKYICIVSADGDKIGKTLEKIKGEKVFQFSKKILQWGLSAKDTILDYGGVPIYIGGDDLLFFAPVCNNGKNIFDLIDSIDNEFNGQKWNEISDEVTPSLSFGLSLTYYKFPLGEAIEEAGKLMYAAKKVGGNAIALKLLKHSGAEFELVLKKSDLIYQTHFKSILNKMVDDKSFLNSVGYKIRDNHELIKIIGHEPSRLENLFHNVFDEKIENKKNTDLYLEEVRSLVNYSYNQHNQNIEDSMKEVFSIIRTSKFIKGLEEVKN